MQKILVIEDNKNIQKLLELNLKEASFEIIQAFDGNTGLDKAKQLKLGLIILDINLPGINGIEVCKQLKAESLTKNIPVIILTVKKDEIDRVLGFELGADDYVTKPFSPRELILRIKAVLRRQGESALGGKIIEAGDIVLDEGNFEVRVGSKVSILTSTEFKLLKHLMLNKERLLERSSLLRNVWGYNREIDSRTVDAHIKSLRRKVPSRKIKIATVIGRGYKLTANV